MNRAIASPPSTDRDGPITVSPVRTLCAILAFASFLLLFGLWDGPLMKTEGHRAITAHQMAEGGDWVVPHLFDRVYRRKPPGHYWTLAVSEKIFGANVFAWRLPSALSVVGLTAVIWFFSRRWFGTDAALAAAVSHLVLVGLWSQSRNADIDAMNTLATATACLCIIHLGFAKTMTGPVLALNLLACSALMMLKGPVGLMAYGGTLVGAAVACRNYRWWFHPGVWAPPLIGLIALMAWKHAVNIRLSNAGLIVPDTGTAELLERITPSLRMIGPIASAIGTLIVATLPHSMVLMPSLRRATEKAIQSDCFRAICGASLGTLAFCVLFQINSVRYGYILLPLLCPPAGAAVAAWWRGELDPVARTRMRQAVSITAILLVGVCLWAPVAEYNMIEIINLPLAGLSVTGLVLCVWVFVLLNNRQQKKALWLLAFFLLPVATMSFARLKSVERHQRTGRPAGLAIRDHVRSIDPAAELWSGEMARNHPELLFYTDMPVRRPPARFTNPDRPVPDEGGRNDLELDPIMDNDQPRWLVLTGTEWDKYQQQYPGRFEHALIIPNAHPKLNRPVVVFDRGKQP